MSSGKRNIVFFLSLIILLTGCAKKELRIDRKVFEKEDIFILQALEFEKANDIKSAILIYNDLLNRTKKPEYLLKLLKSNLKIKDYKETKRICEKYLESYPKFKNEINKIYIVSLINLKEYDKALKKAFKILETDESPINYQIIANIYYEQKKYKKSVQYFESAYARDLSEDSLVQLVKVLYNYTNDKEKAISYLESHSRIYGCSFKVCSQLLLIYQETKNLNGIISTLKRTYQKFEMQNNKRGMRHASKMLVARYIEKGDLKSAIAHLEKNGLDDLKLLSLYKKTKQIDKSILIVKKLYQKTGNMELLAQLAIMEFENAKDKKKVLPEVIKKFEDVISVLNNDTYQNFLGYLLIDYDIDIKRGLALVKQALKKAPNNMAYLDSLAWGQYKLNNCKDAYKNMKIVVEKIGLNDEEIILHWKKIKECYAKHTK